MPAALLAGVLMAATNVPVANVPAASGAASARPVAATGLTPVAATGPIPAAASARVPADAPRAVTLVTGDRLTVTPRGLARTPDPRRRGITFAVYRLRGHLHVVPSDAVPLVGSGRLDPRLFDITGLLDAGYDDRRGDLPLIVTGPGSAVARAATGGGAVRRDLPAVGGAAVRVPRGALHGFWQQVAGGPGGATARTGGPGVARLAGGVDRIWLDGVRRLTLDRSAAQIGAPQAWARGWDGTGVTVAVLDSGIDVTHPDLAGRVVGARSFVDGGDPRDLVGHGTHVASIIAGSGAASGGRYRGVAPGVRLLDGKVCTLNDCAESTILAGMQWAAESGARVVNISLGSPDTPDLDLLEEGVNALTARYGTLFVAAAGNDGASGTVSSPASADAALAVGAVDRDDELTPFSSRGPRVGDGAIKPDITGPGQGIVAARGRDGHLGTPGQAYHPLSGTSMAAPHVAAAAAILAQRHADWRAGRLKDTLMGAAVPRPGTGPFGQGAGRVDVARAVGQTVSVDGGSVSLGRQAWPHHDDTPVARRLTYRNAAATAVTLRLAVTATGPGGVPAPPGMFSVDTDTDTDTGTGTDTDTDTGTAAGAGTGAGLGGGADTAALTVPPGGEATVRFTADTRVAAPDGQYAGAVTATGEGVEVRTPFVIEREAEAHDVTVRHLDRTGAPAAYPFGSLVRADGPYDHRDLTSAETVVRVPRGRYLLASYVTTPADGSRPRSTSLMVAPRLDVTGPATVTVDARRAGALHITVPHRDARPAAVDVGAHWAHPGVQFSALGGSLDSVYAGRVGPPTPPVPGFTAHVTGDFARPLPDGGFGASPYAYHLAWFRRGSMYTGFTRRVSAGQLAVERQRFARHADGAKGWKFDFPRYADGAAGATAASLDLDLPGTRVDYYTTAPGVRWSTEFHEWTLANGWLRVLGAHVRSGVRHRAGRAGTAQWNHGVFGPTLAGAPAPDLWVARRGDRLTVAPPLFGDGADRPGWSATASATAALYRDGARVAGDELLDGPVDVAPGPARYRAEFTVTRGAPALLSTRTSLAFEFTSGHVDGDGARRLPVSVVRFTPRLDQHNGAPAGRAVTVGVAVRRQPGAGRGRYPHLTVEVSYDDGATWTRVRVTGGGDRRTAHLVHPDRAGYVSLRATARDADGNAVQQTVVRAYALHGPPGRGADPRPRG
ncbi:MAG TPA: S8 family serine peptidase [Pilimelia sp.]|nr:S8 family serine peptidase [Pilimelia sp.]